MKIIWSETALKDLEDIFEYYHPLSPRGATTIITDILDCVSSITLPEMFRKDEINPSYRRAIVRHYKIVFNTTDNEVFTARIFDARQDPSKML